LVRARDQVEPVGVVELLGDVLLLVLFLVIGLGWVFE
jgi:hypothetical protein